MVNTRSKTLLSKRGLAGRALNAASCAAGYVFNSVKGLCTRRAPKTRGSRRSGASNKTHVAAPERREYYTNHNGQETYRVVGVPPPRSWHNVYDEAGEAGPWVGGKRTRKTRGRKH